MEKKDFNLVGKTDFMRTIEGMLKYVEKDCSLKSGKTVITFAYDDEVKQALCGIAGDKKLAASTIIIGLLKDDELRNEVSCLLGDIYNEFGIGHGKNYKN